MLKAPALKRSSFSRDLVHLIVVVFSAPKAQNVECAGRAERRRRFESIGVLRLAYPKRSRATLASALQKEFFSSLLGFQPVENQTTSVAWAGPSDGWS